MTAGEVNTRPKLSDFLIDVTISAMDATERLVFLELSSCNSSDAVQCWSASPVQRLIFQLFEPELVHLHQRWNRARALASWRHSNGRAGHRKQMLRCRQEIKCSLPQMSWFSSSVAQRALEKLSQLDPERKRVDTGVMNDYHQSTNTNTRASSCLQACVLEKFLRAHLDLKVGRRSLPFRSGCRSWERVETSILDSVVTESKEREGKPFQKMGPNCGNFYESYA